MLIRGDQLSPRQRKQVLEAFVYRPSVDNTQRESAWQGRDKPSIPLGTDAQFLADFAFHFTKDGTRLRRDRDFAVPVYLADV